jgi:hypothetical protein
MEDKGDKTIFHHAQQVDGILELNKEERKEDHVHAVGDAKWKKVGRIPDLLLIEHPEWMHDPSLLIKFLQSSEGEIYRTVRRI